MRKLPLEFRIFCFIRNRSVFTKSFENFEERKISSFIVCFYSLILPYFLRSKFKDFCLYYLCGRGSPYQFKIKHDITIFKSKVDFKTKSHSHTHTHIRTHFLSIIKWAISNYILQSRIDKRHQIVSLKFCANLII